MDGKVSMVKLVNGNGDVRMFAIEDAEYILTRKLRGGSCWSLADDDYELTEGRLTKKAKNNTKKGKEE